MLPANNPYQEACQILKVNKFKLLARFDKNGLMVDVRIMIKRGTICVQKERAIFILSFHLTTRNQYQRMANLGRFNVVDTFLDLDKSFHESQMYINKEWNQSLRKPIILVVSLI